MPDPAASEADLQNQTLGQVYRALLMPVYVPNFLMALSLSSIMLVIPLFALELGADVGVTSLIFALAGLGNVVMVVPAGYFTSRFGDRRVMVLGVGFVAATSVFAAAAGSALHLSIAAFLLGCSMSLWMLARLSFLSAGVPNHLRGKVIASMAGLARLGFLLGPIIGGFLGHKFGFAVVFLFVAALSLIALALLLIFIRENRKSTSAMPPSLFRIVPHIVTRHWRVFATTGSSIFFLTLLRACRGLLVPLWGNHIGLDSAQIGLAVGIAAAVDMMMFPAAGYLMDNWGRRYAGIACQILLALGLLLMPLSTGFVSMTAFAMVAGFGNGLGSGINMTLGADLAPDDERSEFLGVWRLISDTGAFVGPIFAGYLAGLFTLGGAFAATASLGALGTLIMVFFVKETLQVRRIED